MGAAQAVSQLLLLSGAVCGAVCPSPLNLGPAPTRLLVVVPATGQNASMWASFLSALRKEPSSAELAWLVYDHGVSASTPGTARVIARDLSNCIQEKLGSGNLTRITLIGHSIGGMLVRYAYLDAAGAVPGRDLTPKSWASLVDRILLFTSVNKGIDFNKPQVPWWWGPAAWALRIVPHPHLVIEDFALGSDFIADTRISWIRHFGQLNAHPGRKPVPYVVQFWGTDDSIVNEGRQRGYRGLQWTSDQTSSRR
jgi:pimeloyl-ACP methyl ester carboxylesterase